VRPLLAALALAAAISSVGAAEAQSVAAAFQKVNTAVVIVRSRGKEIAGTGQVTRFSEVGSGVVISRDGKVITAAHVVQTADEITVEFLGGETVTARVIASEPGADVSLLRLERVPRAIVVATLGNSDKVAVGDQVFIIGAPYGIAHSLSVGYVTARHQPNTVYSELALAEFFQTDAAINPGNSGGPMFNMTGEVIGIASHNISRSGGSEGLGFVVTINMTRRLLLEQRSFWSGMSGVIVSGRVAQAINLPQPTAVLVQQVATDSPAARIGLRPGTIVATVDGKPMLLGGDIILAVQGKRIGEESYAELQERLSRVPAGSPITVTVLRDGHEVALTSAKP